MFISLAVVEMGEEDREVVVGVENEVGIRDLNWGEMSCRRCWPPEERRRQRVQGGRVGEERGRRG